MRWVKVLALAVVWIGSVGTARAACTVPNTLTNGNTADATQVMANFNALLSCINGITPGGSGNAVQYNAAGSLGGVGPLTNGQLVVGSTGAAPQAATLTAGSGISISNAAGSVTIAATGGGAGAGLYNQVMSATPTAAGTGLSTWLNQGSATEGDGATGLFINLPSGTGANRASRYTSSVPATPYSITALVALTSGGGDGTNNPIAGLGWTDGTQLHEIQLVQAGSVMPFLQVAKCTSSTAGQSTDFSKEAPLFTSILWLKIADDGTNVSFGYSSDGVNFITAFSISKSSGFLGASGYSHIAFTVGGANNDEGVNKIATLLSWTQGS